MLVDEWTKYLTMCTCDFCAGGRGSYDKSGLALADMGTVARPGTQVDLGLADQEALIDSILAMVDPSVEVKTHSLVLSFHSPVSSVPTF